MGSKFAVVIKSTHYAAVNALCADISLMNYFSMWVLGLFWNRPNPFPGWMM